MSIPSKEAVIKPAIEAVLSRHPIPNNINEQSAYIIEMMTECKIEAAKRYKISPNILGRLNGDWFEYLFQYIAEYAICKGNITVFPGRGYHISKNIKGFEDVQWIPMPDAVVKSPTDLRAFISLKWGLRHDRMYETGYEAYAIKDWITKKNLPSVKVFLVTNDIFSGYEGRLKTMIKVPPLDTVFYLQHDRLNSSLKEKVKAFPDLLKEINLIGA